MHLTLRTEYSEIPDRAQQDFAILCGSHLFVVDTVMNSSVYLGNHHVQS